MGVAGLIFEPRPPNFENQYSFWRCLSGIKIKIIQSQKYSRLRCLLHVRGLAICFFYLGWSGSTHKTYWDWSPKFATWLNMIIGRSSKPIWVTRLLFIRMRIFQGFCSWVIAVTVLLLCLATRSLFRGGVNNQFIRHDPLFRHGYSWGFVFRW